MAYDMNLLKSNSPTKYATSMSKKALNAISEIQKTDGTVIEPISN